MNVSPGGEIDLDDLRLVPEDFNGRRLRRGDVLFNNTNSPAWVGKTALVRSEADLAFSNHMTRLRAGEGVEPSFLAAQLHYLCSAGYFLHQCKKHVNQASISSSFLTERTPFLLPPLSEQRRIVARLDAIEAHRRAASEKLDRLPDLLDRYRQSVLAAAFRGDLTADWRRQHPDAEPASALLERIRAERRRRWIENKAQKSTDRAQARDAKKGKTWTDAARAARLAAERGKAEKKYVPATPVDGSDLVDLPDGWTWTSVDEATTALTSGSRDWKPYYGRGEGTFILAGNVRPLRLDLSERQAVDPPPDDSSTERSRVRLGDVLITIVGANTGDVCRVPTDLEDHFVCQSVALLRPVVPGISTLTERYLAAREGGQRQFAEFMYGQGRPHLSFDNLRETVVPLPPLEELEQIDSLLDTALDRIGALSSEVRRKADSLDTLRQATLAHAFRGELVPTNAALARNSGMPTPAASGPGRGEAQTTLDL